MTCSAPQGTAADTASLRPPKLSPATNRQWRASYRVLGDGSTEVLDLTPRAWCLCQTTVCGHEGRICHLGQGHICRVVRGEVCPQLPDPAHEWLVADSLEIEVCEVCDGNGCSAFIKQSSEKCLSDNSNDLKIEQLRCRETLTLQAFASAVAICGVVCQSGHNDRRVYDDQPESRSLRTASLEKRNEVCPPLRWPARIRKSSRLGRRASSIRRPSKYSWSDFPSFAARRRSSAWTSSGTDLIWTLVIPLSLAPEWRHKMCSGADLALWVPKIPSGQVRQPVGIRRSDRRRHPCDADTAARDHRWVAALIIPSVAWINQPVREEIAHNSGTDRALTGISVLTEGLSDGLGHADPLGGCSKQQVALELRIESN